MKVKEESEKVGFKLHTQKPKIIAFDRITSWEIDGGKNEHSERLYILELQNTWTVNFQMFKLVLEKAEEPETKLSTSAGSSKNQESSRKISISAFETQSLWLCGSQ